MAYLLEFLQDEISNIVGVFDTEENAVSMPTSKHSKIPIEK